MQKIIECEKFFENYYPNPEIQDDDDIEILTDQLSPVNSLDRSSSSSSASSQVYQDFKNDAVNLSGFAVTDSFVQISLIFGVIIWAYNLQRIWKKH
ncbi:hypothetical protein [Nitrosopumilus sp.]|uniref:hypothetical protein n=1 Tax=Nitrosopumilus sp. TaxID=2024843 RepID=UPI0029312AAA|nr:hypothetical protein [Nitrosopumilus sp.]